MGLTPKRLADFGVPQLTCCPWNEGSLEVLCLESLFLPAKLSCQVLFFL